MQQQAMNVNVGAMVSMGNSPGHIHSLEREIINLKAELERESKLRQQEQQLLAEEQARLSALTSEKQALESKVADLSKNTSDSAGNTSQKEFSLQDKDKLEYRLHDMAVMVERLESSRQKLLAEIDSQSSEIEKLFEENSNLTSAYQQSMSMVLHWENQVKDCLKQNEDLRGMLDKLRTEQISLMSSNGGKMVNGSFDPNTHGDRETAIIDTNEVLNLKGQLAKEQTRAEGLGAEVMQLSLQLQQATRAYAGLSRLYKPVLRNIESSLAKIKHDGSIPVRM